MSDAFAFDYVSCKRPSSTEPTMEPWHAWAFTAGCCRLMQAADFFDRVTETLQRRATTSTSCSSC